MTSKTKPAMSQNFTLDISVLDDRWPDLKTLMHQAAAIVFKTINPDYKNAEISVALGNDHFIQDLNHTYRGKNKPTNVLSFPQEESHALGDIAMAYDTIVHEAEEQNKKLSDHAMHLFVHGLLHLMGFDHETDKEALEMEALEIKILERMNIKNPYEIKDSVP